MIKNEKRLIEKRRKCLNINLHDHTLTSINFSTPNIVIRTKNVDKVAYELTIHNVEMISFSDVVDGAIFFSFNWLEATESNLLRILNKINPRYYGVYCRMEMVDLINLLNDKNCRILEITSSYGSELISFAQNCSQSKL